MSLIIGATDSNLRKIKILSTIIRVETFSANFHCQGHLHVHKIRHIKMYLFYRNNDRVLPVKAVILNKYLTLFLPHYKLQTTDVEKFISVKSPDLNFSL